MNNSSTSTAQSVTEHSGLVAVLTDLQRQGWRASELWDGEAWGPIHAIWSADEIAKARGRNRLGQAALPIGKHRRPRRCDAAGMGQ